MRKIKINSPWPEGYHRSGWPYAINALQTLHVDHGILLDDFIENKFAWHVNEGVPPYREPWVGFFHNPPCVPKWFDPRGAATDIIATPLWRDSLPSCQGLFTLSNYLADWLRERTTVPVYSLFHPTDQDAEQFSLHSYYNNENRMVVHIGWWLRKVHSFFLLRSRSLQKMLLLPLSVRELPHLREKLKQLFMTERAIAERTECRSSMQPFKIEYRKDNESYDRLLSRNIVFIDLYDSSANNVIIECIVRNTPLVVNRHPAVIEYLGPDYPLYFQTVEEASSLIEDEQKIEAAHIYLSDHHEIKRRLTAESFVNAFAASAIYQRLPM